MKVDLHIHTSYSDGAFSPEKIVDTALDVGLEAIAITDHDTVDGVEEALAAGEKLGMPVVPGIELSTEYRGCEVHVVGLYVDHGSFDLNRQARAFRDERTKEVRNMEELDSTVTGYSPSTRLSA